MFPAQPEPLSVEYNYNSSAKSNKSICAFSDSEAPNGTAEERNTFDKLGKFKVREASDVQNRCGPRSDRSGLIAISIPSTQPTLDCF